MPVSAQYLLDSSLEPSQLADLAIKATARVDLDVLGKTLSVHFEDAAAAEIFRVRYGAFAEGSDPSVRCFAVGYDPLGILFWVEGGPQRYWPGALIPRHIAFLADAVSMKAFFKSRSDMLCVHGAAVGVDQRAAAIVATTEGGKTTTAIACARRGMNLFTDERVVIADGHVLPFPRNVNVRADGLDLLAAEPVPHDGGITERLRQRKGGDWHSASYSELLGSRKMPTPRPLTAVFFIRGRSKIARAETMDKPSAILELATSGMLSAIHGLDRMVMVSKMLKDVDAYHLHLGSPDETALLIQRTVRGESSPRTLASSA